MPLFLLIRHGENDYVKKRQLAGRLPGVHLNDVGRAQAQSVAEKLAAAPIKAIYSSPLERAMETAEPIAKAKSLVVCPRPNLVEVDIGDWQGMKLKSLSRSKIWKIVQSAPSHMHFPGGESFAEAQLRICQDLLDLASKHEVKDLLVCVTHSDPIKLAVAYFIGLPLDMFQRIQISPASLTALALNESGSQLLTLNSSLNYSYLKPER